MSEQNLAIYSVVGLIILLVAFITHIWRKEAKEATFFDENPVSGFRFNPVFQDMPRDYELIGCKRIKNGMGIEVSFIDESGIPLGRFCIGPTSAMNITLKEGEFSVINPGKGQLRRDVLLKQNGATLATYARTGGDPPGRVAFEDGVTLFYNPREQTIASICPVKYWRDAAGNLLATVFKPTTLDISLVRVIAIKKGLPPLQRAAVMGFYLA